LEFVLQLESDAGQSLQAQIFDQIRGHILSGRLRAGMALPPSRALAEQSSISRNTVILAYERLISEGYIESRGTAGTFVSSLLPDDLLLISNGDARENTQREPQPEPVLCFAGSPGGDGAAHRPKLDFWVGRSASESFPKRIWRKLILQKLDSAEDNLTDYGDPAGLPELRESIAEHLARSRGMFVDADQVVVSSGSQEGLNLVYRLLDNERKHFFVENPCYQGAALLLQSLGEDLHPIPVDDAGLQVDALPRSQSGVVFVTPSHQFPTGATLTLERRVQLLKWAEATDSVIIEDDYDSDFRYDGPPLTALAGLDKSRRVFYLGTFSKSLGAGLRLGYTVVPKSFVPGTRHTKAYMNNGQPWLDQAVLAEFLREGEFERHLRRVRKIYKSRRDHLVGCLEEHFPETTITGDHCGLHLAWQLPNGFPTASEIQIQARAIGVGVYSTRSGAALYFDQSLCDNTVLLGYSSVSENETTLAIKKLRDLVDAMLQAKETPKETGSDRHAVCSADNMTASE
jgi:GntR family transcriptional regulator / MocR family aminotransferase